MKDFRPPRPQAIRVHKIRWIRQYSGRSVGFHYDFGAFSGIGVWAWLACEWAIFDGPFNPTYGLSLKSSVGFHYDFGGF